jgi:hypothetical protein
MKTMPPRRIKTRVNRYDNTEEDSSSPLHKISSRLPNPKKEIEGANSSKLNPQTNGSPLKVKSWTSAHDQVQPTGAIEGEEGHRDTLRRKIGARGARSKRKTHRIEWLKIQKPKVFNRNQCLFRSVPLRLEENPSQDKTGPSLQAANISPYPSVTTTNTKTTCNIRLINQKSWFLTRKQRASLCPSKDSS